MLRDPGRHMQDCEQLIGQALAGFAAELRLIDVIDLIADIHLERHGHLEDMVNSAAELFFKAGALRFSKAGQVNIGWGSAATVTICMQFCHERVVAHFDLLIESDEAGVQLKLLDTNVTGSEDVCQTELLAEALVESQLFLPYQVISRYQRSVLEGELL